MEFDWGQYGGCPFLFFCGSGMPISLKSRLCFQPTHKNEARLTFACRIPTFAFLPMKMNNPEEAKERFLPPNPEEHSANIPPAEHKLLVGW